MTAASSNGTYAPKTQTEALPQIIQGGMTSNGTPAVGPQSFNTAYVHPVFFTNTLRKPPFPLPRDPNPASYNPVALGYLAESIVKRSTSTSTVLNKL
jgi:hypothetical protein